jgi:hypothetical protein
MLLLGPFAVSLTRAKARSAVALLRARKSAHLTPSPLAFVFKWSGNHVIPWRFYEVSIEHARPGEPSEQSIVSFLLSMFGNRPPDLIVPIGGPASTFAHRYRTQLFPSTPMLITAVDQTAPGENQLYSYRGPCPRQA